MNERQKILWLRQPGAPTVRLAVDDQLREYAATLAGVILERRVALGITSQADLAARVGVSEATAGRWERNMLMPEKVYLPDAWELRRLCEVLEVDPDELLNPAPLSPREQEILRRAGRSVRRTVRRQGRAAS